MKKHIINISKAIPLSLVPSVTLAATLNPRGTGGSLAGFFLNIANYILAFTTALSVLFIIIGGLRYIASAGNEQALEGAKKTLTFAVLGLIVVIFSLFVVNFIQGDLLTKLFGSNANTNYQF